MANARTAVAALLGTVASASNTITGAVTVLDGGVTLATRTVESALERQEIRSKFAMAAYKRRAQLLAAQEHAASELDAETFCNRSAEHKRHFEEAMKLLDAVK